MKTSDWLLLAYLRQNARMRLTDLSKKTYVPVSTVFDRIKVFEKDVIRKHIALVDFHQLGFTTKISLLLRTTKEERSMVREYLAKIPCVNSLYKVNNGFDFLAECVFKDVRQMESFVENVEERFDIKAKMTFFVIEDLKRESFLSDPNTMPAQANDEDGPPHLDVVKRRPVNKNYGIEIAEAI